MLVSKKEHFYILGVPWPVWLPDLTVPGFFLWGYLKECIYRNHTHIHIHIHTHTMQKLKCDVWDEITTLNHELLCQFFFLTIL